MADRFVVTSNLDKGDGTLPAGARCEDLGNGTFAVSIDGPDRSDRSRVHIARADVSESPPRDYLSNIRVEPPYRRRGVATALYAFIEECIGQPLRPSRHLTPDGQLFWASRGANVSVERQDRHAIAQVSANGLAIAIDVETNAEQEQPRERTFDVYTFTAFLDGSSRGFLTVNVFPVESIWEQSRGRNIIDTVEVEPECQRRRIASRLFSYAQHLLGPIEQSEWLTPAGRQWADHLKAPAGCAVPIVCGADTDEIAQAMGAFDLFSDCKRHPERYMERPGVSFLVRNPDVGEARIINDPLGRPRLVDCFPNRGIGDDEQRLETVRPPPHLFRAISEADWELTQQRGYLESDQRMNVVGTEGTVAAFYNPAFYLPGRLSSNTAGEYPGRIVRVQYSDEDRWGLDPIDGYAKTDALIPLGRIDMVSARIVTVVTDRADGYTNLSVRIDPNPRLIRDEPADSRLVFAESGMIACDHRDRALDHLPLVAPPSTAIVLDREKMVAGNVQTAAIVGRTDDGRLLGREGSVFVRIPAMAFGAAPKLHDIVRVTREPNGSDYARAITHELLIDR